MILNRCKLYNKTIEEFYDALIDFDEERVVDASCKLADLEYENEHTQCELFYNYAIEMSYERWRVVFEAAKDAHHTKLNDYNEIIYDMEDIIDNLIKKYPRHMQRFNEATERLLDLKI